MLSESNETADELNVIQFMGQPFDGPGQKKQNTVESRDMVVDSVDSTRFDDLDDLHGQRQ